MAPSVSITLIGESYFLCGGGHNIAYDGTSSQTLRNALRHPAGVHNMYIAIAEDMSSHHIHFHDRAGSCFDTRRLYDSYRGLSQYLDEEGVQQCPNSVALSPGGYCFFRAGGARAWNLPDRLDTLVDSALENGRENPLKNVWFGKDDSYVAQKQDGGLLWNLMGYYGNLESTLRYGTSGIKCLGLNLTDENSYIVLFMDGSFRLKAGETGLTSDDIKEWVRSWA